MYGPELILDLFDCDVSIFNRRSLKQFAKGMIHQYIPDLLIEYQNGSLELVEIKPEPLWSLPINKVKWKAAKKWCKKQQGVIVFSVKGVI